LKEIAGLVDLPTNWSTAAYAADLCALLSHPDAATTRVRQLEHAIGTYTWAGFADQLIRFAQETLARPIVSAGVFAGGDQSAALTAVLSSRSYRALKPLRGVASKLKRN